VKETKVLKQVEILLFFSLQPIEMAHQVIVFQLILSSDSFKIIMEYKINNLPLKRVCNVVFRTGSPIKRKMGVISSAKN
jgi:hypothetical protein